MSATIRLTKGSVFCACDRVKRFLGSEGLTRRGVKNEGPGITALPFRGRGYLSAPTITGFSTPNYRLFKRLSHSYSKIQRLATHRISKVRAAAPKQAKWMGKGGPKSPNLDNLWELVTGRRGNVRQSTGILSRPFAAELYSRG